MEQYDVCRLKHGEFVVILQHDTFKDFRTRIVAPLIPRTRTKITTSLNPIIKHAGKDWVLATHLMSVINVSSITKHVGSIGDQDYTIKRAAGQLFLGI